ncbi:MAG TPA: HlyD family efflux transporter periplasmic adaptor subunit [Verrucomicrobiae bacterium]
MKSDAPKCIPVPMAERWRDARLRVFPPLVFVAAAATIGLLWKNHVAAPSMVGQAEPVVSNVTSHKAGVLTDLRVNRFQKVKANDVIGTVLTTDPQVLASSIAVIQADIKMLGASMTPVMRQQRNELSFSNLRLNWMRQRSELAMAKVRLQEAVTEAQRMEELSKDQIVPLRKVEAARATRDEVQGQVNELQRLVDEQADKFPQLRGTNEVDVAGSSDEAMRAALQMQDAKLKLTEAELSPVILKAPMDGIISTVYHRTGEAVMAGQPVVAIATTNPVRIVGYLRAPIQTQLEAGMDVEVRTRGLPREVGKAKILVVGTQLETMPVTMMGPLKLVSADMGLPIDIEIPHNLTLRAGELVDLVVWPKKKE